MPEKRPAAQAVRPTSHPEAEQLERFLRGESGGAERRIVVRHLLTGCPRCRRVTRPIWSLAHPQSGSRADF